MKLQLFKILTLAILVSCTKKEKDTFSLSGSIDGSFNSYIYLQYEDRIDSVLVSDSKFIFQGSVHHPTEVFLSPVSPNSEAESVVAVFMLENTEIDVTLKYGTTTYNGTELKMLELDGIFGSDSQKLVYDFQEMMDNTFHKETNDSVRAEILFENLSGFVFKHPTSELAGKYVAELSNYYGYLNSYQLESLLLKMDTSYQTKKDLRYIKNLISRRESLAIGNIPPSINLPDLNSKMVGTDSYKGKFVLLEFWASWCAPCRKGNPELLKVYEKYRGEEFEILGVSIDKDIDAWKQAVKDDQLTWVQTIDTLGKTTAEFDITTIPYNVLLDRNGEILATNLKPEELLEILENKF